MFTQNYVGWTTLRSRIRRIMMPGIINRKNTLTSRALIMVSLRKVLSPTMIFSAKTPLRNPLLSTGVNRWLTLVDRPLILRGSLSRRKKKSTWLAYPKKDRCTEFRSYATSMKARCVLVPKTRFMTFPSDVVQSTISGGRSSSAKENRHGVTPKTRSPK